MECHDVTILVGRMVDRKQGGWHLLSRIWIHYSVDQKIVLEIVYICLKLKLDEKEIKARLRTPVTCDFDLDIDVNSLWYRLLNFAMFCDIRYWTNLNKWNNQKFVKRKENWNENSLKCKKKLFKSM